eukprot:1114205-Rhodomonas_salina.1
MKPSSRTRTHKDDTTLVLEAQAQHLLNYLTQHSCSKLGLYTRSATRNNTRARSSDSTLA